MDSGRSEFGIYSLVRLSLLSLHVFLRKIGILLHTLKIIMHIINHMTPSSPDLSPDFQVHTSSCLFELLIDLNLVSRLYPGEHWVFPISLAALYFYFFSSFMEI